MLFPWLVFRVLIVGGGGVAECRFKDEEERMPVYTIINTTFPVLLEILNHLLALPNPAVEVADLIKLILKIFWSSAYVSVEEQGEELGLVCVIVMRRSEKLDGTL
jgi:hypothetical protein